MEKGLTQSFLCENEYIEIVTRLYYGIGDGSSEYLRAFDSVLRGITKKELRRGRKATAGGVLPVFYGN